MKMGNSKSCKKNKANSDFSENSRANILNRMVTLEPRETIEYVHIFKIKEVFMIMTKEEKRNHYKVEYIELSSIPNWREYYKSNEQRIVPRMNIDFKEGLPIQKFKLNGALLSKVSIWFGDISTLEIDAIVNPINSRRLGGTVYGALWKSAGQYFENEFRLIVDTAIGEASITGGYQLPAKHVIHAVGPKGENPELLETCYTKCLELAVRNKLKVIAFPCISTGYNLYPSFGAALVAIKAVRSFLEKDGSNIDRIIFCLYTTIELRYYENLMQLIFPVE